MKKIFAAASLLFVAGCLFSPRWITHGNVSFYVPPGFAHTVEKDGSMMVSMAETSAYVDIGRVSSNHDFQEKTKESIDLARRAYGESRVKVTTIASLGKLKGEGVEIAVVNQDGSDAQNRETLFLIDGQPRRMILAGCSSGSSSVWNAYHQILSSLSSR
jgi:hypothetical protein